MQFSIVAIVLALATTTAALPSVTPHVVHETRSSSSTWTAVQGLKPNGNINLPVRIGLTESNLDLGEEILMDVSHPSSPKYGTHLTTEEVRRD